ncbi:MAG: alpha-galactosidase [Roseburia sp.]|nr:alpha-galactosidase [Ruminococcus sp.]MCM1153723.1 alpha-galactosidase [Roseburia sp.]MCM1242200.1 alpha-galactosidase [Roseburia sp.]
MNITYNEQNRIFKLDTAHTSYCIGLVDEENFVGHAYYGRKLADDSLAYLMRTKEAPFVPSENNRDRTSFLDTFPMEYTGNGLGDYREGTLGVRTPGGHTAVSLCYVSHRIYDGKPELEGLPATFGSEEECKTLELLCEDSVLKLQVILLYTVFNDTDVITRSVKVVNRGDEAIYLTKVLSACIDMDNDDYEMITLHGSWARERAIQVRPVMKGKQGVSSVRGESSHQEHPFMAWKKSTTTQESGDIYGMHFVYSGNFMAQIEMTQFDSIRAMMGIHPENFCWKLESGESFQAPEVVCVYSAEGIGGMTRTLHNLYRRHLIRGEYKDKKRPILINNWEATYFEFNTEKLLDIARQASKLGIEMLVMDDGWFGYRNDDNTSLGDWKVNEKKIDGGLKHLVEEVNKLGMKFGIWFEPEMISPDSDLYRAHPDWAIAVPGRVGSLARNQYVLDLTRKEVRDHIFNMVAEVLHSANIEYVKWDMNRQLSDLGSYELPADRQGELFHRQVLAVYELQDRLTREFPHLLLENCSGGGARFDPGMLYYSPQIWCSDDTDAVERLSIQEGTAMIYPLSTMGAHVSDCPNHTVGRVTPFETRGYVALAGTFGYELDVTKIPEEDRNMIPEQVAMYHKYNDLVREGDYYRIASYRENHYYDCYEVVAQDKSEALVTYIQVLNRPNYHSRRIRIPGLAPDKTYTIENAADWPEIKQTEYSGEVLHYAGINIPPLWGDFKGRLLHLVQR